MEQFMVQTCTKKYPIVLAKDFSGLAGLAKERGLWGRRLCIISDSTAAPMYLEQVKDALADTFSDIVSYVFPSGEEHKNLDTISKIYQFFMENRIDRKSVVAALGGGVCGDMAGFAAATYQRGVAFVQIPTTLLAQVDSSVGGKTGVDFGGAKNMVGAFYQPEFVYINSQTLNTLPEREFSAGMAEVIKYGYIVSKGFLETIQNNREKIRSRDSDTLLFMIAQCCRFKAAVVAKDERDMGRREILNFGHTIGHAIEMLLDFKMLHGECVAIGMVSALTICVNKARIPLDVLTQAKELLSFFGLPLCANAEGVTADTVKQQILHDKKVKDNQIRFVLLSGVGEAYTSTDVSEQELNLAIAAVI